jgi:hypothetical protein
MKAEQLIVEIGANYAISNATKASLATQKIAHRGPPALWTAWPC